MESTRQFVEKLHETQEKDAQNRKRQGEGNPDKQLPNKQHSNDK